MPVASVLADSVVEPAVPVVLEAILSRVSTSAVSEVVEADSPASSKISSAAVVPVAVSKALVSAALAALAEVPERVVSAALAEEPMLAMALVLISELAAVVVAAIVAVAVRVPEPTMAR